MSAVIPIFASDPRILATLTEHLPDAPEPLLAYLDRAVRAIEGTPATAQQMALTLSHEFSEFSSRAVRVDAHDVERLGVHDDHEAVGRLCRALSVLYSDYIVRAVTLGIRLDVDTERIRQQGVRDPQELWKMRVEPPAGSRLNPEQREAHLRIFYCALAMIYGVTIDPRVEGSSGGVRSN